MKARTAATSVIPGLQGRLADGDRDQALQQVVDGKGSRDEREDLEGVVSPIWSRRVPERAGVSRLVVPVSALGKGNPVENLKAFGENVISKIG
jgi:hypothetical protein